MSLVSLNQHNSQISVRSENISPNITLTNDHVITSKDGNKESLTTRFRKDYKRNFSLANGSQGDLEGQTAFQKLT